ncbi:MAG TPA: transporter substrate-binding domain-containing protein, partial [Aggregatilineaceae bacterium]|nr:transporter substrate-binding domain-containing protein [Aggregatilineaceae bacterium]
MFKKFFVLSVLTIILSVSFYPVAAAGPIYKDLPDLGGREVAVAIENLFTPFQFENPNTSEAMGYEYDMLAEICARLNCQLSYENASWDVTIQAVAEGQFDLAVNGISITDERKEVVDFSDPYINVGQYLLARADEDRFTTLDEFVANDDLIMGVQQGSAGFYVTEGVVPEERRVVYN